MHLMCLIQQVITWFIQNKIIKTQQKSLKPNKNINNPLKTLKTQND